MAFKDRTSNPGAPASPADLFKTLTRRSLPDVMPHQCDMLLAHICRQERRSRAVSRLVWAEADRRDDLLHKASAAVARSAEVVVTETLHLAGLLRNHRITRSLSEAALGRLVAMVRYKAEKLGGLMLAAPRLFPSSKRCARCGAVNGDLELFPIRLRHRRCSLPQRDVCGTRQR